MEAVKKTMSAITANPVGVLVGAGAGFLIAKKVAKLEKNWQVIAAAVVGGIAGAMIQAKMKAKAGQPTAAVVAEPVKK